MIIVSITLGTLIGATSGNVKQIAEAFVVNGKEQTMSRYIDAEILKERLIKNITLTNAIDRSFNEAPSIDIVRCRECKHWNEEDHWCNIRDSYGWDYKPDDFCSYGEREGE